MVQNKRDKLTEFNRNNILNAAKTLFETNGVMQTKMDDIAKEADYSKSTIYIYFKSKDEIYNYIVYESMLMLKENFKSAIADNNDFEKIYFNICNILTEFQCEYPFYFDSILKEISVDKQDFDCCPVLQDIYNVGEEINEIISSMLFRGINSGYLDKNLNLVPTIFMLWASLCGIIKMAEQKEKYMQDKHNVSKADYLDYSFKLLLKSLKAGK